MKRVVKKSTFRPNNLRMRRNSPHRGLPLADELLSKVNSEAQQVALEATGIIGKVYDPKTSGTICSCRFESDMIDETGHLDQATIDGLITAGLRSGGDDVIIGGESGEEYTVNDEVPMGVYGKTTRQTFRASIAQELERNNPPLTNLPGDMIVRLPSGSDVQGHLSDLDEALGPVEKDNVESLLFGAMNQSRCNVCHGTGYVGGYDVSGGLRRVYSPKDIFVTEDAVSGYLDSNQKTIDKRQNPWRFFPGIYVYFNIGFNRLYLENLEILRLWDNDVLLSEKDYNIHIDTQVVNQNGDVYGPGIFLFTEYARERETLLNMFGANPTLVDYYNVFLDIYCPPKWALYSEKPWTHLEVQWSFKNTPIDIGQVPLELFPNLLNENITTTVVMPVGSRIEKYGVILDSKYNRAWQVTDTQVHLNHLGKPVFYEAECRLMGYTELSRFLPGPGKTKLQVQTTSNPRKRN